jgi:hypothetical protein
MIFNSGGGSYPTQGTSNPPSPIKNNQQLEYFCHTHGRDIHNSHTSTTCVQPGVNHQDAAIRSNTMIGNNKGLLRTILPGATDNAPRLSNQPLNPPTTPQPLQSYSVTMNRGSLLLLAAGASACMQLSTNMPTIFPLPNQEHP